MALHRDPETSDIGRDIANCASRLHLDFLVAGDQVVGSELRAAALCNRRLCPYCEWRRTRVWRARIIGGLEAYLQADPKRVPLFLTLTVRNCPMGQLRQTIRDMHAGWDRMRREPWFPSDAWIRRTEITASPWNPAAEAGPSGGRRRQAEGKLPHQIGSVHPHIHALMMVRPSYFSRGYIKHLEWQQQWMHHARLDYPPVVDVRRGYSKRDASQDGPVSPVSPTLEVAKYASKATDLIAFGDSLPEFHWQMKGLRLYGLSKSLRSYINASDITKGELLDVPADEQHSAIGRLSCVADWIEAVQEYRIVL